MNIKNKRNAKGFILIQAILGLIVMGCVAVMFFQLYGGQFSALAASKESLQAQQYAEFIAGKIRAIDVEDIEATCKNTWDDVENQGLKSVSGWQYKLYCKSEALSEDDPENVIYMVNVAVKKDTDPTSDYGRFSINVPLSSQGNGTSGEAIGTIVPRLTGSFTSASEAGKYLYCDGSIFDTTQYPKLYAILGSNQLPDLRGKFLEGADIGNTVVEAGLPNITGTYLNNLASAHPGSILGRGQGAFLDNRANFLTYTGEGGSAVVGLQTLTIDASRSNTIYGKSTTVQPPAVTARYYIRAK